jgi:hypothetical protein
MKCYLASRVMTDWRASARTLIKKTSATKIVVIHQKRHFTHHHNLLLAMTHHPVVSDSSQINIIQ